MSGRCSGRWEGDRRGDGAKHSFAVELLDEGRRDGCALLLCLPLDLRLANQTELRKSTGGVRCLERGRDSELRRSGDAESSG